MLLDVFYYQELLQITLLLDINSKTNPGEVHRSRTGGRPCIQPIQNPTLWYWAVILQGWAAPRRS
ncbi:MAG: hypothetical protein P8Z67_10525, partial [Gammaproteobacteria bacterium]